MIGLDSDLRVLDLCGTYMVWSWARPAFAAAVSLLQSASLVVAESSAAAGAATAGRSLQECLVRREEMSFYQGLPRCYKRFLVVVRWAADMTGSLQQGVNLLI